MEKYSYLLLDVIFLGLPLCYLVAKHRKIIKENIPFIIFSLLFGIGGFFIVDPFAIMWGAWGYASTKIVGIYLVGGAVVEELLWAAMAGVIFGIMVLVLAKKEEKKKSF